MAYQIEFTASKDGHVRYGRVTRKGHQLTLHPHRASTWKRRETAEKHRLYFSAYHRGGVCEVVEIGE